MISLFLVLTASTVVVSMSALFQVRSGSFSAQSEIHRSVELRQIPIISNLFMTSGTTYNLHVNQIAIQKMYLNDSGSWIYGATNQLTLNGTEPSWSIDEWSFLPLDLSQIPKTKSHRRSSNTSSFSQNIQVPLINVTISTPAIRARLECEPIDQVEQKSSWVSKHNISHPSSSLIASKRPQVAYQLLPKIWNDTFNTSMLATPVNPRCCANESSDTHKSALGYWSTKDSSEYPHVNAKWPVSFLSKWVLGNASYIYDMVNFSQYDNDDWDKDFGRRLASHDDLLLFTEEPVLQAVHCTPIIETTEADVTVDASNGRVQHYRILNDPDPADSAWLDVFVYHTTHIAQYCRNLFNCSDGIVYPNVTNRLARLSQSKH